MKGRLNFVSNSSSSSFIIALPKMEFTLESLKKELFGDEEGFAHPYENRIHSTKEIAEIVLRDLEKPATKEEVRDQATHGTPLKDGYNEYEGYPEFPRSLWNLDGAERDKQWELWDKNRDAFCHKLADDFMKENEGKDFFIVEYSDNDGEFMSMMEHGGIFEGIPHIRISKH